MTSYVLHNPASQAHLEELKDRLSQSLASVAPRPHDGAGTNALIETVAQVVRAMDERVLSLADVQAVLSSFHLPSFSIDRWVAEMIDEGVYLEDRMARAA